MTAVGKDALARPAAAAAAGFVVGLVTVAALAAAPPASAYWRDTGTLTGGTVSTWGLTAVSCPSPQWGQPHVLSWSVPSGSQATISITSNPEPSSFLGLGSSWQQAAPRPGSPQTTTATSTTWGITSTNPLEATDFTGTWTLAVVPPAPTGGWSATRTGTWRIHYPVGGEIVCAVNP